MIEVNERVDVDSTPEAVWAVLSDPHAVVECVKGASLGEKDEEGWYDAGLLVAFGPARVTFKARFKLDLDPATLSGKKLDGDMEGRISGKAGAAGAGERGVPAHRCAGHLGAHRGQDRSGRAPGLHRGIGRLAGGQTHECRFRQAPGRQARRHADGQGRRLAGPATQELQHPQHRSNRFQMHHPMIELLKEGL